MRQSVGILTTWRVDCQTTRDLIQISAVAAATGKADIDGDDVCWRKRSWLTEAKPVSVANNRRSDEHAENTVYRLANERHIPS